MKHALVNRKNEVVNIIIWDGRQWLPPIGHYVIRCDKCDIGDIYDKENNVFIKPEVIEAAIEEKV